MGLAAVVFIAAVAAVALTSVEYSTADRYSSPATRID